MVVPCLAIVVASTAHAAHVDRSVALTGGPSQLQGSSGRLPTGFEALLTYERARWLSPRTFWSWRVGYGASRVNIVGLFFGITDMPVGLVELRLGVGDPTGGPCASVGLGIDVFTILPLPLAATARVGWRLHADDALDWRISVYGRGLAFPFLRDGDFPGATRWSAGLDLAAVW